MSLLDEKLNALCKKYDKAINLGLERIQSLLDKLGNPEQKLPLTIHVAGTNGKGSVIAFLKAFCEQEGLKVHVYNSPHFVNFNERIVLAGDYINDDFALELVNEVEKITLPYEVSFFEFLTAVAFLAFSRIPADVLLLETGMGGRLDATNVVKNPLCSIITSISMDHIAFLGDTLEKIAYEKACILKKDSIGVIAEPPSLSVEKVFKKYAFDNNIKLLQEGKDWQVCEADGGFSYNGSFYLAPALLGKHQYHNAGLAITVAKKLLNLSDTSINKGLQSVKWAGRLQQLKSGKLIDIIKNSDFEIWLDGGHNEGAGEALADFLPKWQDKPLYMISAMLTSKDAGAFLGKLCPFVDEFYAVPIKSEHSCYEPYILANIVSSLGVKNAFTCSDCLEAIKKISFRHTNGRIFICGSLYLLGEVFKENLSK